MKTNKSLLTRIFTAFLFLGLFLAISTSAMANDSSAIYLFYGLGCPHCTQVEEYFEKQDLLDKYSIEKKEIYFDRDNALLFNKLLDELDIPTNQRGVPAVIIGDKAIIGDKPIIENFVSEANKFLEQAEDQPDSEIQSESQEESQDEAPNEIQDETRDESQQETADQKMDLTLAVVIGASIVDAINPCAFAVLIILMTTILATGDGKKALKTGIAFASSIFISYFLMGLGLYKALGIGGISGIFYKIIGWLALVLGLLNLKDYFWYGKGFLMEVPMAWRPKMKSLIRSATSPLGAFGVGFLVSLILLPCTSGPYIVILGMLAKKALQVKAILYLILYNLIFISPMILISLAVYKGYNPAEAEELRQKRLKTLHLVAGLLMLAMGIVILKGWI